MRTRANVRILLAAVLIVIVLGSLSACGWMSTPLKSITFNSESINLFVGSTHQLTPTITPTNADIDLTYSSSDSSKATVSATGLVTGVAVGNTTITVTDNESGKTASVKVIVEYDELKKATLVCTTNNKVQLTETLQQTVPPVGLAVHINEVDYTSGNFNYSWYNYIGSDNNTRGRMTAAQIAAVEADISAAQPAGLVTPISYAQNSAENSFTLPTKTAGTHYSIIVRVSTKDETPTVVWSNVYTFGVYEAMSGVAISIAQDGSGNYLASTGFEKSSIESFPALAQLGKVVHATLDWNPNANADPDIQWSFRYKSSPSDSVAWSNMQNIIGQTGRELSFTVTEPGYYELSAIVDGKTPMATGMVRFATRLADIANVTLSAQNASHQSIDNPSNIQLVSTDISQIIYTVGWNSQFSGTEKPIKWFVNGVEQVGQTSATFAYTAPSGTIAVYTIKATVFNNETDTTGLSATATVNVVARYVAIKRLTLAASDPTKLEQINSTASDSFSQFTVNATLNPTENINPLAEIKWYKRSSTDDAFVRVTSGIASNGKSITYTPTATEAGEVHIYAEVDNVRSNMLTYVLIAHGTEHNDYQSDGYNLRARLDYRFNWNGIESNALITSVEELANMVCYVYAFRKNQVYFVLGGALEESTSTQVSGYLNDDRVRSAYAETGNYKLEIQMSGGIWKLGCDAETLAAPVGPSKSYNDIADGQTTTISQLKTLNYSNGSTPDNSRTTLYIDGCEEYPEAIFASNQLYVAVGNGYKPTFTSDAAGTALASLYNKARTVLQTICTDDMTDYQKVAAIYDWIIQEVEYDYDLANIDAHFNALWPSLAEANGWDENDSTQKSKQRRYYSTQFNGFYLEGVFNDKLAVCDGKSKAFVLLCGMEGITAKRVSGLAMTNSTWGGHAWNKVLLDVDETDFRGYQEWFLVDSTWDDRRIGDSEYMLHSYFLTTDEALAATHDEDGDYPATTTSTDFDSFYYKNHFITYDGNDYSMYIESNAQLTALRQWAASKKVGSASVYLEVKFDIDTYATKSAIEDALLAAGITSYAPESIARSDFYVLII